MNRIDGSNPLATSRTTQGLGAQAVGHDDPGAKSAEKARGAQDQVKLSNRARFVADASRAVANAPDVRSAKVAALKASIASGSYQSSPQAVAERLLASGSFGV
jgi:flagellar biosynthesis anti-sigma factor FlgM